MVVTTPLKEGQHVFTVRKRSADRRHRLLGAAALHRDWQDREGSGLMLDWKQVFTITAGILVAGLVIAVVGRR